MNPQGVVEELPHKRDTWCVDVNTEEIYVFNCTKMSLKEENLFTSLMVSPLVTYETSNRLSRGL